MSVQQILLFVDLETVLIIMMEHFMNVIVKMEQWAQELILLVLSHALVGNTAVTTCSNPYSRNMQASYY